MERPVARAVLGVLYLAPLVGLFFVSTWLAPIWVGLASAPLLLLKPRDRKRWTLLLSAFLLGASLAHGRVRHDTQACFAEPLTAQPPDPTTLTPWTSPGAPLLLVQVPARVTGDPPPVPRQELPELVASGPTVRALVEPTLDPVALELQVELDVPGEVAIYPSARTSPDKRERGQATTRLPVEAGSHTLTLDLGPALEQGWDGAKELQSIEVALQGRVVGAALLGAGADMPDAAGVLQAEADGVLRPSWYVHPGATASFDVVVPQDGVLDVFTEGPARVFVGDTEVVRGWGPGWTHQRAALPPGPTTLILRADTETAVFGDPRIQAPAKPAPNVVVYMVDTLRADHIGALGNGPATPAMDRLVTEGATFGVAQSTSSWTKPAIPSLMTGIRPTTHRVGATTNTDRVPAELMLVQERFREAGWATASFSASPLGSTLSGLDRGFDAAWPPSFWELDRQNAQTPTDAELHSALLDWWSTQDRPVFAYVHTLDTHQFYLRTSTPDRTHPNYLLSIQDADTQLADFLAELERRGLAENTLVVLVADHGESFHDHGLWSHGTGLAQSQVHIPLVFWMPGTVPQQLNTTPVSLIDVAPTLVDLAGLDPLPDAEGRSLRDLLQGTPDAPVPVASDLLRFTWNEGAPQQHALVQPDGTKVWDNGRRTLTFNVVEHPCEESSWPVFGDSELTGWVDQARAAGEAFAERFEGEQGDLSGDELERLRQLGYIE